MKLTVTLLAGILFCTQSFSQVSLTKGETIAYLDKKIKECVGHKLTNNNGYIGEIKDASVEVDSKGIIVKFTYNNGGTTGYWATYAFNPANISNILPYENNTSSPLGEISIQLTGKTSLWEKGTYSSYPYVTKTGSETVAYANFLNLRGDPTNFEKIKKALLYLRDLMKAEDDPFK